MTPTATTQRLALLLLLVGTSCSKNDLPSLVRNVRPSVVSLTVFDHDDKEQATGTGFIVSSNGQMVTSYHVVKDCAKATIKTANNATYKIAGVLSLDELNDLAILKIDGDGFAPLGLAPASEVEVGTKVAVIGDPLGLTATVSEGIVSGVRPQPNSDARLLQITAPISPGSSGSPVVNQKGQVIGVAASQVTDGQALNFAVPTEAVAALLKRATKVRTPEHLAQHSLTVQTSAKTIRLSPEKWKPLTNETQTARNFEARTLKPTQVYGTVITIYLIPMSADRALGKKLTDTEFLEIFSEHPGTVTVQLRIKRDGYWILSRETLKMPEPAVVGVRQSKKSFTDDEVTLVHHQLQTEIDETRAFVRTEL